MTLPYLSAPSVDPEAMSAAAYHVQHEYGYSGYTLKVEAGGWDRYVFRAHASDGAEFRIMADRYGNVWDLPDIEDLSEAIAAGVRDEEARRAERWARFDEEMAR